MGEILMGSRSGSNLEVFFGLFGILVSVILLIITIFLTPDYSPLKHTVSTLGDGAFKSLFSISFVIGGSSCIPFYIYLERELIDIKENIRRLATAVSIFTNVCVALVGIIRDESWDSFLAFHGFVAMVSFVGSSIYIVIYSILMYNTPKAGMYRGPAFKKYLAYFGFAIGATVVIFFLTFHPLIYIFQPLIEWILTLFIFSWIIITALQIISSKFFSFKDTGIYFKRSQFPEALELFERALKVLENVKMSETPITETLKENIEYLKKTLEKKPSKLNGN
ncbi:hypothetical protein LCGC14_0719360 [marine sediment metagenome]|uniref:DUF998 domain-containing protein n=1 Tax=marine sediment metagenome TaxID=412755 RepID=A0A0F9QH28_9ZZZZ